MGYTPRSRLRPKRSAGCKLLATELLRLQLEAINRGIIFTVTRRVGYMVLATELLRFHSEAVGRVPFGIP